MIRAVLKCSDITITACRFSRSTSSQILAFPQKLGIQRGVVRSESEPALTIRPHFQKEWKQKLCAESYVRTKRPNRISHQQSGTNERPSALRTEAHFVTQKSCFVILDQGDRCLNLDGYHIEDHRAAVAKTFRVSGPLISRESDQMVARRRYRTLVFLGM